MIVTLIFLASLFTALGFFDKWVKFAKCGLIIPITGFAHSMTSAAIEYKNYDKAIIISSDGDFACLMRYLKTNKKLGRIITPTESYSSLLRPFGEFILPLKSIKQNISFHKKTKQQSKKPAFAFGSKP